MSTHYDTLKVTRDADDEVIESAYRALMKKYHPDKTNGDLAATERAKLINAAYSTLRDPQARERYDRTLTFSEPEFRNETEPTWSPTPDPTPAGPARADSSHANGGWLISLTFITLALTVATGAVGSLMQPSGSQAAASSTTLVDSTDDGVPAPQPSELREEQDTRSEPSASPVALAAPKPEESSVDSCIGASTAVSYLICTDSDIATADARLNSVLSARLENPGDHDALRADQNAWFAKRDGLPADRDRILQAYEERIRVLQAGDLEGLY
ncbi:DnaJ domain-containing protein [Brevundimonas sp.]|uniref:DnaJ domain-containing protein n=1 Tax=Brevundimonas sp. TaxID=1871086 RepID=UPI002FC696D2